MNGGSPSGFINAPVTRTIVISSALFTILFGIQSRSKNISWSYQDIFKKLQIWKLIVSVFGFSSIPELVFGTYLMYYFRVFERQIGSNKYTVFALFSFTVSLLLQVLTLWLLKVPSMNILTSGPYGLIFSSFVPFYFDIPISTRFRVLSLNLSDKTFIYLAGLQLFLSSWRRSTLPGVFGILAGALYRLNVLRIRRAKFSGFMASFFSRLLSGPTTGSDASSATISTRSRRPPPPAQFRVKPRQFALKHQHRRLVEPGEESISALVSMGFERNAARQALLHAGNDVNVATNILLESQSH
ncbi:hypothetical protein M569_08353 [Genlisea aurea]|uniref:UBA domain-containing protein n=1 Tax=Genlisea aurea TaxID=192259 RepID=S8DTE6_9LAMI|nr:hypothetical protein M569_08353 [Genlisea aurea]